MLLALSICAGRHTASGRGERWLAVSSAHPVTMVSRLGRSTTLATSVKAARENTTPQIKLIAAKLDSRSLETKCRARNGTPMREAVEYAAKTRVAGLCHGEVVSARPIRPHPPPRCDPDEAGHSPAQSASVPLPPRAKSDLVAPVLVRPRHWVVSTRSATSDARWMSRTRTSAESRPMRSSRPPYDTAPPPPAPSSRTTRTPPPPTGHTAAPPPPPPPPPIRIYGSAMTATRGRRRATGTPTRGCAAASASGSSRRFGQRSMMALSANRASILATWAPEAVVAAEAGAPGGRRRGGRGRRRQGSRTWPRRGSPTPPPPTPCPPAGIVTPRISTSRVASRATISTEVSQRSVSSTAHGTNDAIGPDALVAIALREQRHEHVADQAEGRFGAGRRQQAQEADHLLVRESFTVDLACHQAARSRLRPDCGAVPGPPAGGSRAAPSTPRIARGHVLREADDLDRPLLEAAGSLLFGTSIRCATTCTGKCSVNCVTRSARLATGGDPIEELVDHRLHHRRHRLHVLRHERRLHERARAACAPCRPSR